MNKKQTAVSKLLNAIPEASEIKDFIEENNADTKMLDEWLWERIYKGRYYLQMEREQIVLAHEQGRSDKHNDFCRDGERYYEQTYGSCTPQS